MKTKHLMLICLIAIMGLLTISTSSCKKESKNLDSALYGTWTYEELSWTFVKDGTCIQTTYGTDYNWEWEIEDEKLKLFITGGLPTFYTYKIEGNLLYLWVDSMNTWGLPFTKE